MRMKTLFLALPAVLAVVGCGQPNRDTPKDAATPPASEETARPSTAEHAMARIEGKSGSSLSGEATLTGGDDSVEIIVRLANATPGVHAVHLHENGDCSASDAASAGGHWNPAGAEHGMRGSSSFHSGDIGNIEVGSDGTGTLNVVAADWSLHSSGSGHNPVGKAIVIHSQGDDFATQPDGAAGQRVGCGVIESRAMSSDSDGP
jgi:Cu-Zn family superoxide dismutase